MKHFIPSPHLVALLFLLALMPLGNVQAASGLPGSHALANSGQLNPQSALVRPALSAAAGTGMDWVFLDVDWSAFSPQGETYNLQVLTDAVQQAAHLGLHVALSLRNPPAWAMQETGPDAEATANLVTQMVGVAPQTILAVELFPAPNTSTGWGAPPNPAAYAHLLRTVQTALETQAYATAIVVGGLAPDGEVPAAAFLEALYRHDLPAPLVVGLAYPPFAPNPQALSATDSPLWQYETLRAVMLAANRPTDLLWITRLTWQAGSDPAQERAWVSRVYALLQQQLYIGLVNFDGLVQGTPTPPGLVDNDGRLTPYFTLLGDVISGNPSSMQGALMPLPTAPPTPTPTFWKKLQSFFRILLP